MKKILLIAGMLLAMGQSLLAQDRDTVYVSHRYTTSFYFPTNAVFAKLSSEENVFSAFAKETNEVIYTRARGPFEGSCSLTVIEASGKPHTYVLLYRENPPTLLIDEKNDRKDIRPDTLRISSGLMTTLLFSTEIVASDLSRRRLVVGDAIKESPNVFNVMAREPHDETSSLSILEESGDFHTYILVSDENPSSLLVDARTKTDGNTRGNASVSVMRYDDAPSLTDVHSLPQGVFHIATRHGRISVVVENIFTYSDIMYMTIRLDNRSGVSYETDGAIFTVEKRRKLRRQDDNKMNVVPSSRYKGLSAPAGGSNKVTYSFKKLTLNKEQVMVVKIYEKGYEDIGGRSFILKLSPSDINLAERPVKTK